MIRRSVSSWLSPGPRVPMPPPVRDRWVHSLVRRGSWYSSWASSTWRRPSWVWACSAKMSRISRLRSMTLTFSSSSRARCWAGDSSSSAIEDVEAGLALGRGELLGLALADVPVRVDVAAVLPLGADDVGAGGRREVGELGERVLGGPAVVAAGVDGDEEGLLDGCCEVDERRSWWARGERIAGRRSGAVARPVLRWRDRRPRRSTTSASSRRATRRRARRGTTSAGAWRTRRSGSASSSIAGSSVASPSRTDQASR